ncbi:universal stress protein [Trueperella sp. LYQ143]|uniref:universal stress protein n=1 Tax=unclassified Trueperella TaxID=2630174 RepID=UPI003982E654
MPVIVPIVPGQQVTLEKAIEVCRKYDSTLIALLYRPAKDYDAIDVDQEVDALTDVLEEADIAFSVEVRFADGELSEHISQLVEERQAELVVVGLARRPANGKIVLGSQIQRLLTDVDCAVLVVRDALDVAK